MSQGEFAELIDDIVADAKGFGGQAGWVCFGSGQVGDDRGLHGVGLER